MFSSRIASRLLRWGPLLLAACVLALYLATLSPGVTFTDGPELLTAVVSLGVAHPTGYPVFILAGHAFCKLLALPLPAYLKMETFNALCGAGAAFFAAITTRDLARLAQAQSGRGDARDATVGGLAAGLLMATAPLVWEEVRIPEVYALHLFLATWAGYAWTRFEVTGRTGYVLGAALPMGIGLAHHVTMVYMLPAAFFYLMVRRPSFFVTWITTPVVRLWRRLRRSPSGPWPAGWWGFPVACVVGFLPLLSYGFLIWANEHTTGVSWGGVHDWDSLYGHFTGRQYQGFMTSLDRAGHVARIRQLPSLFDAQFLPAGTVLFFVGLLAAFRRIRRPALFFFAYGLFNVAHGAHYGVGDYGTYYLPAIYTCAVFMGIGLATLMGIGRRWPAARRASAGLLALSLMLAGAAASIAVYARFFPRRLPAALAAHPAPLVVPLAVLAALAFACAVGSAVRPPWRRPLRSWALPAVLAGGLLAALAPVAVARAHDQNSKATVGESYGAEVAGHLPPGAVFMTQGDGFLFTMWYENHVQGRATDVATVDMGNLRTPWFQHYVFARSPVACDPLGPEATLDPAAYARRCDTYRKRIDLGAPDSWVSFGVAGNRRRYATPASTAPVLRGSDPRCAGQRWHDEHAAKECRCWRYGKSEGAVEGMLEEDCVESAEEGGVVPRDPVEIFAQRIIEDMLEERPVFERNVLTQWAGAGGNPRGWDGPTYQRVSGDYALLGRGRFNQIVWAADVSGIDACGGDTFRPVTLRAHGRPRALPPGQERRRPYRPNAQPTLLQASYLVTTPGGRDDDATREIAVGEAVYVQLGWFERFTWDGARADRRGKPIRHGVRVCAFDPDGRRVAVRGVVSGAPEAVELIPRGAARKVGVWHVAGCDVGELAASEGAVGEERRCVRTLLEYELEVK